MDDLDLQSRPYSIQRLLTRLVGGLQDQDWSLGGGGGSMGGGASDKEGWVSLGDSQYDEAGPLVISANTPTKITNNASSELLNYSFVDGRNIWDSVGNQITPLEEGSSHLFRVNFQAKPNVISARIRLTLDIGGSQGVIWSRSELHLEGAGNAQLFSFFMPFYVLATFMANGGDINIESDQLTDIYDINFTYWRES